MPSNRSPQHGWYTMLPEQYQHKSYCSACLPQAVLFKLLIVYMKAGEQLTLSANKNWIGCLAP